MAKCLVRIDIWLNCMTYSHDWVTKFDIKFMQNLSFIVSLFFSIKAWLLLLFNVVELLFKNMPALYPQRHNLFFHWFLCIWLQVCETPLYLEFRSTNATLNVSFTAAVFQAVFKQYFKRFNTIRSHVILLF